MNQNQYYLPNEDALHEGTWLIWPHEFTYGKSYKRDLEPIWIEMVKALYPGENIHIIAYNDLEKMRIINVLKCNHIPLDNIDFFLAKSNDVWIRDTGPIFVKDQTGKVKIANFSFDGWGRKCKFELDDAIPKEIAKQANFDLIDIPEFVLEGGSIELDGVGTLMATKSSVFSKNRNPKLKQNEVENYLKQYFNVSNFIWLEGVLDEDITDAHIDGIARFYDERTILTVSKKDFFELYENILECDYSRIITAKNSCKNSYKIVELPLTEKNVKGLRYKGNYLNYYIGNQVVLVPVYKDKNDALAIQILRSLFTDRKIVPIDVTKLYKQGGMIHCVTQQQPKSL